MICPGNEEFEIITPQVIEEKLQEFLVSIKILIDYEIYYIDYIIEARNKTIAKQKAEERLLNSDQKYEKYKIVSCRKRKPHDKEDKTLVDVIPKKYEATFNIKIKDKKFKKCFIIETINEDKVPDLVKIRCKREFSSIKSITKIQYKLADENSKEYSEEIVEDLKPIKSDEERITDVEEPKIIIKKIDNLHNLLSLGIGSEDFDSLDYNNATNLHLKIKSGNLLQVAPASLNVINRSKFKKYFVSVTYTDESVSNKVEVLAIDAANALIEFTNAIELDMERNKLNKKLRFEYLYRNALRYNVIREDGEFIKIIPARVINKFWSKLDTSE